jgi:hypothetical protein
MHWLSTLQPDRHCGRTGSHMIPPQLRFAPITQVPPPLQVEAAVTTPLTHLGSAQRVPDRYLRQAPVPLQVPSVPQLVAPWSWQVRLGSWPPAATEPQTPGDAARLQDWQTPSQRLLQQTPCAQKPLAHWASREHRFPCGSFPHEPPTQLLPVVQSALLVQVAPQRLPLQRLGAQLRTAGVTQAPAVQTLAAVQREVAASHD